ncbi:MAG: helix-turn-helix transcriptional regulator [Proteobacteria bacterium]|nr:helix-turn-helix transcriptional regulator [Pseudomonadota bacterium]
MNNDSGHFRRQLLAALVLRGLSQRAVYQRLGLSNSAWRRRLWGEVPFRNCEAEVMCHAFGVDVEQFHDEADHE